MVGKRLELDSFDIDNDVQLDLSRLRRVENGGRDVGVWREKSEKGEGVDALSRAVNNFERPAAGEWNDAAHRRGEGSIRRARAPNRPN